MQLATVGTQPWTESWTEPSVRAECPSHPLVKTALANTVQGHSPEQRDFPIVFELLGETPTCYGHADLYFQ